MTEDLQASLAEKMEQVQWHGEYFSAICPFPHHGHKESHPSMMVYTDGFVCMGCRKNGKLEYLLQQVSKSSNLLQSFSTTKPAILPRWGNWSNRFGDLEGITAAAYNNLNRKEENKWWFKRRKIDGFIHVGYFGYLDGWAIFPVLDKDTNVIDIVVRATKGKGSTKYVLPPAIRTMPNIYVPNWNRVLNSDTVYIVYGIVDSWSFESIELPVVTGTTGKSLSPERLKPLDKKWIIIPDRYEEDAAYQLANKLGWKARVQRIKWPSGIKDCDEIRMTFGNTALRNIIGV